MKHLEKIIDELISKKRDLELFVPAIWMDINKSGKVKVDYKSFLICRFQEIKNSKKESIRIDENNWTAHSIVYNLFVRFFTAYDHADDGKIGDNKYDITLNDNGIRETGTFIKTIALLPYLKKLGINTIHLLPITEIGREGKKGDLGSPYAIKNPLKIDPLLADPLVNVDVEIQYKAFIEAAHHLGIRVVQEFIFRTTSIDSDWVSEHPNWFYWVKEDKKYAPPKFTAPQLTDILKVPKGTGKFIPPSKAYRNLFEFPSGKRKRIASAFADWPPNDLQPPWSDVTYLRLYNYDYNEENNFNYIAYNTIRYYDPELAKEANINQELWNKIAGIIPYYQKNFGIDGAMIDMGHALPNALKSMIIGKARQIDSSFAFWDENFDNAEEAKKEGYNAVIGDVWYSIAKRNGFRNIILAAFTKRPLPFFGTPETHNTPRFGYNATEKKKSAWLLFKLLPNAIPFIHNGFELNEYLPVNTGLNFKKQDIDLLSGQPLALFNKHKLNWDTSRNIVSFILKIKGIALRYPWIFDGIGVRLLETDNNKVMGFIKEKNNKTAIVLFNTNFHKVEYFNLKFNLNFPLHDLLLDKQDHLSALKKLRPGKCHLAISGE